VLSEKNTKVTKIEQIENKSVLHLTRIVAAHAGEYTCEASNVKGKKQKHFHIVVTGLADTSFSFGWVIVFVALIVIGILSIVLYRKFMRVS
jgi:hypothetical protein